MSASSKAPKGLKDSECEKGHLGNRPPVPYVPPTDLLQTKESSEVLKIKLPNGTVFSMGIFAKGTPEDYLQHIIAVLRLIDQKGLHTQCKKHAKEMKTTAETLIVIKRKLNGSQLENSDESPEDLELERKLTQELLSTASKQYNEAVGATYELLRNLLAGEPQTQWDCIVREMHERGSWAGADGERHNGKRPKGFKAFMDCLELHKLTVFTADAAERQRYYVQQGIRKPQRATVRQFISRVEVLNGYLKYLPTLKDSPKAVTTTKKGNIPFEEADLASIMLAALPLTWQNQYNLTHSTVPESPRALLADLENIERVMIERYREKQRSKDKATTARPEKGKPKRGASAEGSTIRVPKKARTEKFCQRCKTHGGSHLTHNTNDCRRYDKDGKPLGQYGSKPSEKHKPYKKHGGDKGLAYMTSMLEAIQKGQKKYSSSSDSDSE
jgi:hypothetical protein